MPIRWHDEAPEELREAIRFTSEETAFAPRLIEKDYFCSVILEALAEADAPLVFKGGTCLAKVHSGFYRLSEDLDFSMPTAPATTRSDRSRAARPVKEIVASLPARIQGLEVLVPLEGHNASTQYNATLGYRSLLALRSETIQIEVGLREPIQTEPLQGAARTALLSPVTGQALVDPYPVTCLSYEEAMAEKLRAALCRRDIAIRDFFDVDHAVHGGKLDPMEPGFLKLVQRKLEIPGTDSPDVSDARMDGLGAQLDAQLRPVLREREFARFDLGRAVTTVRRVAQGLAG